MFLARTSAFAREIVAMTEDGEAGSMPKEVNLTAM